MASSTSNTVPRPMTRAQRAEEDKVLRTKAIVGTKDERAAHQAKRRDIQRHRGLAKMTPAQREDFLKKEAAGQAQKDATSKRKADDKTLRTKGIVGTKEERAAHKEKRRQILRDRALEKMTPAQREAALKKESENKAQKEAAEKRKADDKTLRTKAIVGTKEERQAHRDKRREIMRDRTLEKMTPAQREAALKKESENKAQKEAADKRKADDKTRRTVAKVGNKDEREKFRAEKARVERDDKLAKMTPKEREAFLAAEAQAAQKKQAQEAQEAQEKKQRQVAVVGDKNERQQFRNRKEEGPLPDRPSAPLPQPPPMPPPISPDTKYVRPGAGLQAAVFNRHVTNIDLQIALLS